MNRNTTLKDADQSVTLGWVSIYYIFPYSQRKLSFDSYDSIDNSIEEYGYKSYTNLDYSSIKSNNLYTESCKSL